MLRVRRTALLLLSSFTMALGQASSNPVTVKATNGIVTFTNTGTVSIAAIVATTSTDGNVGLFRHDYYFNKSGFGPSDYQDFDMVVPAARAQGHIPQVSATVVFLQFADGSTWGDAQRPEVREMIAWRKAEKEAFQNLVAAYASGGDTAFQNAVSALPATAPERFVARLVADLQKQGGSAAAVASINDRLAAAAARDSTGKF